jgi:NAD(P)-dependent dehydrogenase (short-subunit alcohol dehydrogenase family)
VKEGGESLAEKDWTIDKWYCPPNKLFDVKDKVTIVTGASSGLGRAIALAFDALGAKVILADINVKGAEEVSAEMTGDRMVVECDVTSIESVQNMIKKTMDKYGRIDVAFNVPGINIRKEALDLTYEEWDKVLRINLDGMFYCCKEEGKVMLPIFKKEYPKRQGAVINMASIFAELVMPRQVAYGSSKGAIRQMTRVLAAEWAPYIRVNSIGPCYMETPLVKQVMADKEWYEAICKQNVLRRFGKPEEVVGTAIFLASDASSLYTGCLLTPDAGWHWFGGWLK